MKNGDEECTAEAALAGVADKPGCVSHIAGNEQTALNARNGALAEEHAENPQQDAGADQYQQVQIVDARQVQGSDGG